jgi:solute carrier family 8 (sodium/calcium exchanger)
MHLDSAVYDKVLNALEKPSLVRGIKQASPLEQTSCLEGFHSVVNQFAPKMIAYSYNGMFCR